MPAKKETKNVVVRFDPDVHEDVKAAAALAGVSFNTLVNDTMRANYGRQTYTPGSSPGDVLNRSRTFYAATVASNSNPGSWDSNTLPDSVQNAIAALGGAPTTPKEDTT